MLVKSINYYNVKMAYSITKDVLFILKITGRCLGFLGEPWLVWLNRLSACL